MQFKRFKKLKKAVVVVLVITFSSLSCIPSYSDSGRNLHPQYMSKPYYVEIGDKGFAKVSVMEMLASDPDLFRGDVTKKDVVFSCRSGKELKVIIPGIKSIDADVFGRDDIAEGMIIPLEVDGKELFAFVVFRSDGSGKITVNSREEHIALLSELGENDPVLDVETLLEGMDEVQVLSYNSIKSLHITDISVSAALAYFEALGDKRISARLTEDVNSESLRMLEWGELFSTDVVVEGSGDEKARLFSIIGSYLRGFGINHPAFNSDLERFWTAFNAKELAGFSADPDLRALIAANETDSGNEGGLLFEDSAYNVILDIRGVELTDCYETIMDVKRIISEVARYKMDKHNALVDSGERSGYIDPDDMPGLDVDKIIITHISDAIIPTEIHRDGYTFINDNFIKLMYLQGLRGMKGPSGEIFNIPELAEYDVPMGELYSSIIYCMAIHMIEGHHEYASDGSVVFNPDEILAQTKRGNKEGHLYVNLLAMMYYWIVLVEKDIHPRKGAIDFMKKYKHIFHELEPGQRAALPYHLEKLALHFMRTKNKAFPFTENPPASGMNTGFTREDYLDTFNRSKEDLMVNRFNETEASGYADGKIVFRDSAFSEMIDVGDVGLEDCSSTMEDIREAYVTVARHDMEKHNRRAEEVGDVDPIMEEDMVGLDGESVRFDDISELFIPVSTADPRRGITVNEQFVKIMHKLKTEHDLDGFFGRIARFDRDGLVETGELMGYLYRSMIYANAINMVRGRFPINDLGMPEFVLDDTRAIGERGASHLYLNVLATLFYWIVIVEAHEAPASRAELYVLKYPGLVKGLTEEQKEMLPHHLWYICKRIMAEEASPFPSDRTETGLERGHERDVMLERPGAVSTEGSFFDPGALVEVFNVLFREGNAMTLDSLREKLPLSISSALINDGLRLLLDAEVIQNSSEGNDSFELSPLPRGGEFSIARSISGSGTKSEANGHMLNVTQKKWAHALIDSLDRSTLLKGQPDNGQKIVVAIEADYVPLEQKASFREMLQEAEKVAAQNGIVLVRKTDREAKEDFADRLVRMVESEEVAAENMVVIASSDLVNGVGFRGMGLAPIRSTGDGDVKSAFIVGVDPSNIKGDSYIRMLEIMTMSLRRAFGKPSVTDHSALGITYINKRLLLVVPKAEKVDIRLLPKIYKAQASILKAA